MNHDNDLWLKNIKITSRAFIENNYINEVSFFDIFWDSFSSQFGDVSEQPSECGASNNILTKLNFANENALDLVTPVVLATVAETLRGVSKQNVCRSELEKLISRSAACFGAAPGLTASLIRHLPSLCMEILSVNKNTNEAHVTKLSKAQYEVWTNGEKKIVDNIDEYEKYKDDYLFWIDLNEKSHVSKIDVTRKITHQTVNLLKYLVMRIDIRIPAEVILSDVFGMKVQNGIDDSQKNLIEQHISKLHTFCKKQFRGHLFAERFKQGLGLKASFADKYFLFRRLR